MDLLKPGLSKLALLQIRNTNTISARLGLQYRDLVEQTNTHFFSASSESLGADVPPNSVQEIFRDFYYTACLDKPKNTTVPEVSLRTLQRFQERLALLKDPDSVSTYSFSEAEASLVSVIEEFSLLIAFYHLSNAIIEGNWAIGLICGCRHMANCAMRCKLCLLGYILLVGLLSRAFQKPKQLVFRATHLATLFRQHF